MPDKPSWSYEGWVEKYGKQAADEMVLQSISHPLKVNYNQYIHSPEWIAKSDAAKARAENRCQVCNSPDKLDTHHRTYERLGCERDSDLTVLCRECHRLFTDFGRLKI